MRKLLPECVAQFHCPDIVVNSEQGLITCWEPGARWWNGRSGLYYCGAILIIYTGYYVSQYTRTRLVIAIPTQVQASHRTTQARYTELHRVRQNLV
jgi:hypothetical protein